MSTEKSLFLFPHLEKIRKLYFLAGATGHRRPARSEIRQLPVQLGLCKETGESSAENSGGEGYGDVRREIGLQEKAAEVRKGHAGGLDEKQGDHADDGGCCDPVEDQCAQLPIRLRFGRFFFWLIFLFFGRQPCCHLPHDAA